MARIVRISDMTDDEKEKWREQVNKRNEELISNRQKEQERASQLFNEYISKNGAHDTTKHTTTIGNLKKTYKNYSNYDTVKNSLDKYYEMNKGKDLSDDLIGVGSNAVRSFANLLINARENIGRRMKTDLNNRFNEIDETNYRIGYNALKERGYSEEEIKDILNNGFELKTSEGFNNFTNKMGEINEAIENKFSEWENANNQKIQENIENASNPVSKKVLELTPAITQSSVNLIPGGQIVFASGTTQNYYEEAKNERGMSDEEADKYASIMSTMETVSEAIGAKLTKNVGKALVKENVKEAFINYGLDIGENFLEEAIMEPTSELTTTIVAGKDKANWDNMGKRMLNAGINGALSSILMGGASAGVGSAVNVVNKISNGQTVSQSEIQTAMKDIQKSETIDVEGILKNEIQKSINNTSNLQQNSLNNQTNLQEQQVTQIENNIAQNQNMEPINNTLPVVNEENRYNLENNQQTLYNNNESESGINGKQSRGNTNGIQTSTLGSQKENAFSIDRYKQEEKTIRDQGEKEQRGEQFGERRNLGSHNKLSRIYEESLQKQEKQYTRAEYEQWEQSIKPITDSELTKEQQQLKSNIRRQYGKDVVFFDGKNNPNGYSAGASFSDNRRINIDISQAKEFGLNKMAYHEVLESNILYNRKQYNEIIKPTIEKIINDENFQKQKQEFWAEQNDNIPNDILIAKDIICDRFAEIKSGEKLDYENVLSQETNMTIDFALENFENILKNNEIEDIQQAPSRENNVAEVREDTRRKTLNPTEISQIKREDASSTPKLKEKSYARGNKISSFYENITETSQFLNEDFRKTMQDEENIKYYKGITNEKTLEKAFDSLKEDGSNATINWATKDSKNATTEDVAKGWILLKQYQDNGDYQSAVEVAKKMRDIGTKAGQTVQAYNILSRLTPEGMFYYAQSELSEAYNKIVEGKSKKWIDANKSKFDLTPEETQFIMDTMKDVSKMEDGYNKKVKLAEIQKLITDKIPTTAGQSIKAWMRISMLFNPKTQVRNIAGNAIILPVNMFSDSVSAGIDKLISKKTGVRTTGNINIKSYAKGFGQGLYESYNDFKRGINTRNIQGNRFEVSEGKSFNNKGIGKALNRVDSLLSFMLDAGDRGFYEATFTNSINNQLILNNTTEVTQDMIDIATKEALQRTWQDNNRYTQIVLTIRNALNGKVGKSKGVSYGVGDILIPFAKTPANLTKAIVDYSPVGLVNTITSGIKLKNSLETGQYTAQLQHQFVQNIGKATAGTFLYVLGYALAKAGIATGEADEDKDVKNFMKNSLGISSYSIKIGDKTFTYDWAQPIAAPLSIMTNVVNSEEKGRTLLESVVGNLDTAGSILLEQSFLQTINEVLSDSDGVVSGLINQALNLPARAIPTFSKQIADMVDGTQRTSFEYDKPVQSAINSVVAKIPFASKALAPSVDTLGNEIQKYGGNNNIFNVFFNPANTNKGQLSEAGKEIYDVYMQTGDTTIFPRTAPYYINSNGNKVTMDSKQRSEFQRVSGQYVEKNLEAIMNTSTYTNLSNDSKAEVINEIVCDAYDEAKDKVLNISSEEYKKEKEKRKGISNKTYYDYKIKSSDLKKDNEKIKVITSSNYSNKEKIALYENYVLSSQDETYPLVKQFFSTNGLNIDKYLNYKTQDFSSNKKDDGTVNGKTIYGSSKEKRVNYISNMKGVTYTQKLLLLGIEYTLNNAEQTTLFNYINSSSLKNSEKLKLFSKLQGFTVYKNGTVEW